MPVLVVGVAVEVIVVIFCGFRLSRRVFTSRVVRNRRGIEGRQRRQLTLAFGVDDVYGLHTLPHMSVEVAEEVPETIAGRLHCNGGRLTWVDGYCADILVILPDIIAVPVHDVSIKTHVPDIPNSVLILAHLEWRAVGVDVTVQLIKVNADQFCF